MLHSKNLQFRAAHFMNQSKPNAVTIRYLIDLNGELIAKKDVFRSGCVCLV